MSTKKIFASLTSLATILAVAGSGLIPTAQAAVNVTASPNAAVTSPITLPANSAQTELFSFSLNATSGETLSNIMAEVDMANASTTVSGSHIASLSLYQDNGSNSFNPATDALVGTQTSVNIGSPTTITPATTTPATGEFYLSLATSGSWSGVSPADSITATMPSNAINTSDNSPETSAVTTATISAQAPSASGNFNVTVVKYVNGQPAASVITDGDTFSAQVTYPGGDGNYILGPGNPTPYQITSSVPSGDSYSAYENIYGAVGPSCASGLPYVLSGYTTGTTLAQAASATPSTTMPSFSNLSSDEYVIIWNSTCAGGTPTPTPTPTPTSTPSPTPTPTPTACSDGLVNGSIYLMLGDQNLHSYNDWQNYGKGTASAKGQIFIVQNCDLVPYVKPTPSPTPTPTPPHNPYYPPAGQNNNKGGFGFNNFFSGIVNKFTGNKGSSGHH